MKIEEIKKMLNEISPIPWNLDINRDIRDNENNILVSSIAVGELNDFRFIAKSPEIISELIKKIESLEVDL